MIVNLDTLLEWVVPAEVSGSLILVTAEKSVPSQQCLQSLNNDMSPNMDM